MIFFFVALSLLNVVLFAYGARMRFAAYKRGYSHGRIDVLRSVSNLAAETGSTSCVALTAALLKEFEK